MTLEQFKKLVEQVTPGPWKACHETAAGLFGQQLDLGWEIWGEERITYGDGEQGLGSILEGADAQFIAACRDMVPKLLAVAEEARRFAERHQQHEYPCDEFPLLQVLAALEINA